MKRKAIAAIVFCMTCTVMPAQSKATEPGIRGTVTVMQDERQTAPDEIKEEIYYDSLELLAICVEAEAGNQTLLGKRMVTDVILNRVEDEDFPDTIEDVISQYPQFASFWDGGMDKVTEPTESTIRAVQLETEHRSYPELFYFTAGDYGSYGTPWKKVGDHYFCTK